MDNNSSEIKKLVLVIGNGFDLDLGLKTSYKDFCNSQYCPSNYPAPLIRHLNQKWPDSKDAVRWYDLENEFLNYVKIGDKSDVLSKDEIEYVKKHGDYQLCNKLNYLGCDETFQSLYNKGYIEITDRIPRAATIPFREELAFNSTQRDKKSFDLIHEGVASFITKAAEAGACTDRVAFAILFCASQFSETGGEVAIHSFNYTPLPSPYDNSLEKNMFYVHGSCKQKNIVLGTKEFEAPNEDYNFLQKAFDVNHNPSSILDDLQNADDVIIFGHSLGENDDPYFRDFFQQQAVGRKVKKRITIFTKSQESEIEIKRSLQRLTGRHLTELRANNDMAIIKTDDLYGNHKSLMRFMKQYIQDERYIIPVIKELKTTNNSNTK